MRSGCVKKRIAVRDNTRSLVTANQKRVVFSESHETYEKVTLFDEILGEKPCGEIIETTLKHGWQCKLNLVSSSNLGPVRD